MNEVSSEVSVLADLEKGRILLVDDEPLIRKTLSRYLEKRGHSVLTAENGQDALDRLADYPFDLIITDLQMPVMDGRGLLKILAEKYNDVPRIVLTAVGSNEDILLALKTGAYDFLSKPITDFALLDHAVQRALEKKKLSDDRRKSHAQIEKMNEVISLLNRGVDSREIFKMLDISLKSVIPFNKISLISFNAEKLTFTIRMVASDRNITVKEGDETPPISKELYHKMIERKNLEIVSDFLSLMEKFGLPDLFKLNHDDGLNSAVMVPMVIDDKFWGYLMFVSELDKAYGEEHIRFLKLIAGQIALSIQRGELLSALEDHTKHLEHLVKVRTHEILKTQKTTIFALSKLAEIRDTETGEHLERMRNYCMLLSQLLKYNGGRGDISNDFIRNIYDSSILHDIGKVGIPDMVLLKPGSLTPEEWSIMQTHSTIGFNALDMASKDLGENSYLDMARDIALYHHERWDGKGYPVGVAGESIPLSARIVTIGDIYDALTSKRPYKEPFSHEKAIQIMQEESYRFDPILLKLFIDNHGDFDRIRRQFI